MAGEHPGPPAPPGLRATYSGGGLHRIGSAPVLGSFSFADSLKLSSLPPLSFPTLRRSLTPPGLLTLDQLLGFIRHEGGVPASSPSPVARPEPFETFLETFPFPFPTLFPGLQKSRLNLHNDEETRQRFKIQGLSPRQSHFNLDNLGESPPSSYSDNCLESPLRAVFRQLEIDGLNFFSRACCPSPKSLPPYPSQL